MKGASIVTVALASLVVLTYWCGGSPVARLNCLAK